jgi:hypothetical protein
MSECGNGEFKPGAVHHPLGTATLESEGLVFTWYVLVTIEYNDTYLRG